MAFYPIAAAQYPQNARIDFSPLNDAINNYHQAQYTNALLSLKQGADARSAETHDWQRQAFQQGLQDRKNKALGTAAQYLLSMPKEQRPQALNAWRAADPTLDADLGQAGYHPEDIDTWGPVVVAKARGLQDPLGTQKTQAEINETNAKADYYRSGGRMGSTAEEREIDRLMHLYPDLTYPEAMEHVRTHPKDRTQRMRLGSEAARYGLDDDVLNPALDHFGVGPNSSTPGAPRPAPPPAQPNANLKRFDFTGRLGNQQNQQILNEAHDAIRRGADPAAVRQRLRDHYGIANPGF